eukprot:426821-Prymnesium_polylepis.1
MLGGRRRGCGWLRARGCRGPARVGAAGVGGDDQRVQGEPAPPAAGRRHQMVILCILWVPRWERQGCACHWATLRTC